MGSYQVVPVITLSRFVVILWLPESTTDNIWPIVLNLLNDSSSSAQALGSALKLSKLDGVINTSRLTDIIERILDPAKSYENIAVQYKTYSTYHDLSQHSWIILGQLVPKLSTDGPPELLKRLIELMTSLPIIPWENLKLFATSEGFTFDYTKVRKAINLCWSHIMKYRHSLATRKQTLILLLENLIMHIDKPILLTDFLMDSLDIGGPISLLALQGVFTLIQEHNITYPFIYKRIYFLFDSEIFYTKYKPRLFYLTDLFLSSTHLPENLVAGFVKRVARLALVAPPQDIVICLQFITNLMIRHKGLKRLLNDPTTGAEKSMTGDPYLMEEEDPSQSNAIESSLWEVEALTNHALPTVSQTAKTILKGAAKIEYDLSQVLEITEGDIFEKCVNSGDNKTHHLKVPTNSAPSNVNTLWALY